MDHNIYINNVSKEFTNNKSTKKIFNDFNLKIQGGKINCVIGPSGCGKTTLINMIAGFEKVNSGEILYGNKSIYTQVDKIGVCFQDNDLFPWKNVMENILFACNHQEKKYSREDILQYLRLFGLEGVEEYYPKQLSGGMKQRISLLRVLLTEPDIVILDEAFGALDIVTRYKIQEFFLEMHKEKKFTAIVITHDIMEAIRLGEYIYMFYGIPSKCEVIENDKTFSNIEDKKNQEYELKDKIFKFMNQKY